MNLIREIAEVEYKQETKHIGTPGCGIDFIDNVITFEDGSIAIRFGIQNVYGQMIKDMIASLQLLKEKSGWWSLQTTSIYELKAAYKAGFRNRDLSGLKQHIVAFNRQCGTLHVELIGGK